MMAMHLVHLHDNIVIIPKITWIGARISAVTVNHRELLFLKFYFKIQEKTNNREIFLFNFCSLILSGAKFCYHIVSADCMAVNSFNIEPLCDKVNKGDVIFLMELNNCLASGQKRSKSSRN